MTCPVDGIKLLSVFLELHIVHSSGRKLSGIPYISIRIVTRTREELQDLERAMNKQTSVGDLPDPPYVLSVDRPPAARRGNRQVGG